MSSVRLSVIIPTLNEGPTIKTAIESCFAQGVNEVVVADGSSKDATPSAALSAGATLIQVVPAQRARQMNAGAHTATGDVLIFLHADTFFTPGAIAALRAALRDPRIVGGGFERRYKSTSKLLRASSAIGNARARCLGWTFGDQAIWARADAFRRIGGFPEKDLFEDLDFTRRLCRLGQTRLITPGIVTSARRFQTGVLSRLMRDILLTACHVCLNPTP
ncbi:MAG: TIGR04283 family arsenosugar biosynthesis glycosyltransferase [Candidatus Sumerlaeia bacterium]